MPFSSDIIGLGTTALVLLVPPMLWHAKMKNTPAIILIFWLMIMDLKLIVDAAVWSSENFMDRWNGKVWCDIMIKLQLGANVGISCAIANIAYNLHGILKADSVLPEPNSRRKLLVDLSFSLLTPVMTMGLSYIAQVFRYGIARYNGCQNLLSPTWITVVLYTLWMFIWSLIAFVYAILLLYVFYKKRTDVKDILYCTNSGLNLARFARLLFFCFLIVLVMFPFSMYSFVSELKDVSGYFDFNAAHDKSTWTLIIYLDLDKPFFDVWLYILMSYLVFIIFGLGSDALGMYGNMIRAVGLGFVLDNVKEAINSRKQSRANKLVSSFYSENGSYRSDGTVYNGMDYSPTKFIKRTMTGENKSDSSHTNPYSPSGFIIDYTLPNDKRRQGRQRRCGSDFEDLENLSYLDLPYNPVQFQDETSIEEFPDNSIPLCQISYQSRSPKSVGSFGTKKDAVIDETSLSFSSECTENGINRL